MLVDLIFSNKDDPKQCFLMYKMSLKFSCQLEWDKKSKGYLFLKLNDETLYFSHYKLKCRLLKR